MLALGGRVAGLLEEVVLAAGARHVIPPEVMTAEAMRGDQGLRFVRGQETAVQEEMRVQSARLGPLDDRAVLNPEVSQPTAEAPEDVPGCWRVLGQVGQGQHLRWGGHPNGFGNEDDVPVDAPLAGESPALLGLPGLAVVDHDGGVRAPLRDAPRLGRTALGRVVVVACARRIK